MSTDEVFRRTAAFISNIHTLESELEQLVENREFSTLQQNLLRILYFSCSKNISALSACMNMNLPNTSREVKHLTDAGLILKTPSPRDRRIVELSLTDEGRRKVEEGLVQMKEKLFAATGEWTRERMERYLKGLSLVEAELFADTPADTGE